MEAPDPMDTPQFPELDDDVDRDDGVDAEFYAAALMRSKGNPAEAAAIIAIIPSHLLRGVLSILGRPRT